MKVGDKGEIDIRVRESNDVRHVEDKSEDHDRDKTEDVRVG